MGQSLTVELKENENKEGISKKYKMTNTYNLNSFQISDTVVDTLNELYENNGKELTPFDVLEEAKNPDSPLHKYFEWDNDNAAYKFRLIQARELIASVKFRIISKKGEEVPVRVFYNIVENDKQFFKNFHDIDEGNIVQLKERFLKEIRILQMKFSVLDEYKEFFKLIEEILNE